MKKITETLEKKAIEYVKSIGDKLEDWNAFASDETFEAKTATETKEIKDGDIISIKGYLSTFGNTDRDGDIVHESAFDDTLKQRKTYPLQRDHSYKTEDFIGDFKAKKDEKGLYIDAEMLVTPGTYDLALKVKSGKLNTLSMGGAFKYGAERDKKGNSIIEKVMLFEGSVVPIPANPEAKFEAKSLKQEGEKTAEVPQEPATVPLKPEEKALLYKKFREEKKR